MSDKLAIDGGSPVRAEPMPPRHLIGEEEKNAAMALFAEAMRTGNAFGYGGTAEQEYEQAFCRFMGGGFADAVNSGTNAVYCALGALRLEPFSEVIVPPITDPGGAMPVPLLSCIPVVADAAPDQFNMAADQIEPMITPRTRAILVAHIGGDVVDMDPIMELARSHGLKVVEDCAQAPGALYKGRLVGTIGDIASFSTMSGKHITTGGQGGMVYTRNEERHWQGRRFADRGKPFNMQAPGNVMAGLNCNLNDLFAAIGQPQLAKLPEILRRRRIVGETIKVALHDSRALKVGKQIPDSESAYWFLRIRIDLATLSVDKARFCSALAAEGLPVTPHYRHIPCEAPWFRNRTVFGSSGFPWTAQEYTGSREPQFAIANALQAVETHFNLAIHEGYGEREIADTIAALKKVEQAYLNLK